MAITCQLATSVAGVCVTATVLGPSMHIFDEDDNEITLDELVELSSGLHTFRITNTGESNLHLDEITSSDETYVVTQPLSRDLAPGEETTFTITVP